MNNFKKLEALAEEYGLTANNAVSRIFNVGEAFRNKAMEYGIFSTLNDYDLLLYSFQEFNSWVMDDCLAIYEAENKDGRISILFCDGRVPYSQLHQISLELPESVFRNDPEEASAQMMRPIIMDVISIKEDRMDLMGQLDTEGRKNELKKLSRCLEALRSALSKCDKVK